MIATLARLAQFATTAGVVTAALSAGGAQGADSCPNASLRTGPSRALPDCRAYELVSTGSNHGWIHTNGAGVAPTDGDKVGYSVADAPDTASSGQLASNVIRATRDSAKGWSAVSLSPPVPDPITGYWNWRTLGVSSDLSATFETGVQPLAGGPATGGFNAFVGRPFGIYRLLTPISTPNSPTLVAGNADFSHVYFTTSERQLASDPLNGGNTYSWAEGRGLRLLGILPDGTPAVTGASLGGGIISPLSQDGSRAVFVADGKLYVRIDDQQTVEASLSRRTNDPDLNPGPSLVGSTGITASGSTILFLARANLTNDANTGHSSGVATNVGADLYSYDIESGSLKDLTVDTDAADAATGANVQRVLGATVDGTHIYFTATGKLAPEAPLGHTSLYVWHDDKIEFVADTTGFGARLYVTPDGQHAVFASTDSLTGYDNTDPATGQPHAEVFLATLGAGLKCVSCHVNGTRPTADSTPPAAGNMAGGTVAASDDGRRVFFESSDAVVPQAASGLQQVFQYEDGTISPISRLASTSKATMLAASPSGNDVFFTTHDDLVPNPNSGDSAVFDARVGGGFSTPVDDRCDGAACRGTATPTPMLATAASVTFLDDDNAVPASRSSSRVIVSKTKTIIGTVGALRVKVPSDGRLTVTGSGLQTKRVTLSRAQTASVPLVLTTSAIRTLRSRRSFRAKVQVLFSGSGGPASSTTVTVTFKVHAAHKGRS